jgi:hypothetical protein
MGAQPIQFASVPKPVPDLNEIQKACKVVIGTGRGRIVEIRAMNTPERTWSGYYSDSSFVQHVYDLSAKETTPNVYWTIQNISRGLVNAGNALIPGVSNTTKDSLIDRFVYLPVDCDPKRPAGTSATDTEKAYARDVAEGVRDFLSIEYGMESILADSGNGYHILMPIDLEASPENIKLVRGLLKALKHKFESPEVSVDTSVYNPSRILKIYGSVARKGEHTDSRPWRTSRLVDVPSVPTIVTKEALRELLANLTKAMPLEEISEITEGKKYEPPARGIRFTENRNNAVHDYCFDLWRKTSISVDELRERVYEFNREHCLPPLDEEEIERTTLSSVQKHPRMKDEIVLFGGQPSASLSALTGSYPITGSSLDRTSSVAQVEPVQPFVMVDGDAFMLEKMKPRKVLCRTKDKKEAVFYAKSINQIFAWRGNGKTNLGMGLVWAFATAGSFLNFEVPEKVNVLYIEGELPEEQVQERWKQIIGNTGGRTRLVTLDKQPEHRYPSLASEAGIARMEETLKKCAEDGFQVDVLFLDSIGSLLNMEGNEEGNWIRVQSWFMSLRSRGICLFFMHHAGKSGLSRSHSKSEDMLDVSIKLDNPTEREEGCLHAVLHYDKARHGLSEPDAEIKMKPVHTEDCVCRKMGGVVLGCRGDKVEWHYEPSQNVKKAQAFEMWAAGGSVRSVARDLEIPQGTAARWHREWKEESPSKPVVDLNKI